MPLSRLTNYVDGNVLTGAQLNNEFDNILNNGPALVSAAILNYTAVAGLAGSIISNIGSFQANAYQLRSTSGTCALNATSSYSINTQTVGPTPGGRDQAAVFASTQIHFYAITTGGTSTNARGICSSQPPTVGPTLPAGYSAWGYLASVIYTPASSVAFVDLSVKGSNAYLNNQVSILNNVGPTAGVLTSGAVALASYVPTVATHALLGVDSWGGEYNSTGRLSCDATIASASSGVPYQALSLVLKGSNAAGQEYRAGLPAFSLPLITTPPALYYQVTLTLGTTAALSVSGQGYTVPNGDVG